MEKDKEQGKGKEKEELLKEFEVRYNKIMEEHTERNDAILQKHMEEGHLGLDGIEYYESYLIARDQVREFMKDYYSAFPKKDPKNKKKRWVNILLEKRWPAL